MNNAIYRKKTIENLRKHLCKNNKQGKRIFKMYSKTKLYVTKNTGQ